ncbi:hypothetical protein BDW60DRAFT_187445 [Aspergillus nidulans var. acristatus]
MQMNRPLAGCFQVNYLFSISPVFVELFAISQGLVRLRLIKTAKFFSKSCCMTQSTRFLQS